MPLPATAPVVASHPLDPLTARGFAALKKLLLGSGGFSDTVFSWVQLQEPSKQEVLAFKPGAPLHRQAFVVALSPERKTAFEIVADLTESRIVSTRDLENLQPYLASSEFDRATKIINESADVRAALEKRGFKLSGKISKQFWVDLYAPGEDPLLTKDGKTIRGVRALFATRQGGRDDYGPYLDGFMALMDLYEGKVIAVQDSGGAQATRPAAHDVFSRKVLGPPTRETPLEILPRTARDLHLTGNHVQWVGWDFRYSFNQREGLVLHQIGRRDGNVVRSICSGRPFSRCSSPTPILPRCSVPGTIPRNCTPPGATRTSSLPGTTTACAGTRGTTTRSTSRISCSGTAWGSRTSHGRRIIRSCRRAGRQ